MTLKYCKCCGSFNESDAQVECEMETLSRDRRAAARLLRNDLAGEIARCFDNLDLIGAKALAEQSVYAYLTNIVEQEETP